MGSVAIDQLYRYWHVHKTSCLLCFCVKLQIIVAVILSMWRTPWTWDCIHYADLRKAKVKSIFILNVVLYFQLWVKFLITCMAQLCVRDIRFPILKWQFETQYMQCIIIHFLVIVYLTMLQNYKGYFTTVIQNQYILVKWHHHASFWCQPISISPLFFLSLVLSLPQPLSVSLLPFATMALCSPTLIHNL